MIKEKEHKKKFLEGLFDEFDEKMGMAFWLMTLITILITLAAFVVKIISIKWALMILCFYCICYLLAHSIMK